MKVTYPDTLDSWNLSPDRATRNLSELDSRIRPDDALYAIAELEKKVGANNSPDTSSIDYILRQIQSEIAGVLSGHGDLGYLPIWKGDGSLGQSPVSYNVIDPHNLVGIIPSDGVISWHSGGVLDGNPNHLFSGAFMDLVGLTSPSGASCGPGGAQIGIVGDVGNYLLIAMEENHVNERYHQKLSPINDELILGDVMQVMQGMYIDIVNSDTTAHGVHHPPKIDINTKYNVLSMGAIVGGNGTKYALDDTTNSQHSFYGTNFIVQAAGSQAVTAIYDSYWGGLFSMLGAGYDGLPAIQATPTQVYLGAPYGAEWRAESIGQYHDFLLGGSPVMHLDNAGGASYIYAPGDDLYLMDQFGSGDNSVHIGASTFEVVSGGNMFIQSYAPGLTASIISPTQGQGIYLDDSAQTMVLGDPYGAFTSTVMTIDNLLGFILINSSLQCLGQIQADTFAMTGTTTSAPSTAVGAASTTHFGTGTNYLGTPSAWMPISVGGTNYKIPLYS